jgi:hypothetical protein
MTELTRDFLESIGLPRGDLHDLPSSAARFADGAQYRVEIPSTEGPALPQTQLRHACSASSAPTRSTSRPT